jgi:hypothetical protein
MGTTPLGALRLIDVDQPSYRCAFEAAPAFEALDEAARTGDGDRDIEIIEEMAAKGIRLIWPDGRGEPRPDMEGSLFIRGAKAGFRPDRVRFSGGRPVPDA